MARSKRTTPPPCFDVLDILPELAGREKTTVRLHPRRLPAGKKLPLDASKLGGDFLWPASEPWPICERHKIPFVGILQLQAKEFPEVEFPPGTDLLQLLWCPQDGHHPNQFCAEPTAYWRRRASIRTSLAKIPKPRLPTAEEEEAKWKNSRLDSRIRELESLNKELADVLDRVERRRRRQNQSLPKGQKQIEMIQARELEIAELRQQLVVPRFAEWSYLPKPCELFPERVVEYPNTWDDAVSWPKLDAWFATHRPDLGDRVSNGNSYEEAAERLYQDELSVASGTKLGGYVQWIQGGGTINCTCGQSMDHLLTLASDECDGGGWRRWLAQEDRPGNSPPTSNSVTEPSGMVFGDCGKVYVFVCRHCKEWPIRSVFQCG